MSRASFMLRKKALAFAVSSVLAGWSACGSSESVAQDNLAQDNLAQDNLAQDNLAQDNLAQDNLAQDNLAQDNLAQDNLAQDNLAQDNLAQDNLAQDNLAQDNLAQDNLAQDNLAQDNLAQDNLAQDNLAQDNLAQDNLAQDNLAQDAKLVQDNVAQDTYVAKEDSWPPNAVKTIVDGETAAVPSDGITIKDTCDTKTGTACNVLMQGGTPDNPANIANTVTVIVEGTSGDSSIVVESGNNTFTNNGTVTVATGATAVQVRTGALTIDGTGTIKAAEAENVTNTTGVSIATGGSLTNTGKIGDDGTLSTGVSLTGGTLINSGTIGGTTEAVKITGSDPATTTFTTSSVVAGSGESPVAIDASGSTGKVTVNIEGGTFTGDIKGKTGTGSELNIKATSDGVINDGISDFENINITGAGWTAKGWVSGATTVDASSAIADFYVSDTEPTTPVGTVDAIDTLRVATGSATQTAIETTGDNGKITNLHISGAAQLTLSDGKTAPGSATVDNIKVNSAADWILGSALSGIQTVTASRPASESSKSDAPTVITNISLVGTGADADADAPAKTLNISSPMPPAEKTAKPIQINAAEPGLIGTLTIGADAQFGAVTNVDDIVITAENWQSTGVITNPKAITVGVAPTREEISARNPSGKVTAINYVASAAKSGSTGPGSLDVTFNQQADQGLRMSILIRI